MNTNALLHRIRRMKDRDALAQISNAVEARDLKLSRIEGEKERARLWKKVEALKLKKGDMVFIHTGPTKKATARHTQPTDTFLSGQHSKLWGKPLTVHEVKPRAKEIVVRAPGSTVDHRLSPFTCEKLKLSTTPNAAALANGLMERVIMGQPIHNIKWPNGRRKKK